MKPRYFQNSQSRILLTFLLLALSSAWAQNPVPSISTPLFPDTLAPGGPSFVLTVDGSGFVSTSVVEWNGTALPTTFVSSHQLKVVIPSADIVSPGTAWITVSNGGITSNVGYFEVTNATTSILVNPNFPALKGATCATPNFAFGGAADGDTIALGVPNERMSANATVIYTAWVSAANTVTLQACDILGTQKTAGTGSIRIDLWKH